ncbi:MAG: hypothetical protein HPY89_01745 [Pelotomaculum sp.]|nr:hypothetical protein [Pelotomaculum sp.]
MAARPRIKIKQKVRIARADLNKEEDWYLTDVQDIGEDEFCVSIPFRGTMPMILRSGDPVKVSMVNEGARIEFNSRVTGWRADNIPMYVLSIPDEYRRVQEREFVRIPAMLDVFYAEVPEPGAGPVFIDSYSLDLSAGGIRIVAKKNYPKGAHLLVRFSLPLENGPVELNLLGTVVRTQPVEGSKTRFQVALKFIDIKRKQQDLIFRYIFNKMLEPRRPR